MSYTALHCRYLSPQGAICMSSPLNSLPIVEIFKNHFGEDFLSPLNSPLMCGILISIIRKYEN